MISKDLREAVEQAKIFKSIGHPDREEICGRIIDPLLDLAKAYLSVQGMPEKKELPGVVDTAQSMQPVFVGTEEDYKKRQIAEVWNEAVDKCTLAHLKSNQELLDRLSVEEIVSVLSGKTVTEGAEAVHNLIGGK